METTAIAIISAAFLWFLYESYLLSIRLSMPSKGMGLILGLLKSALIVYIGMALIGEIELKLITRTWYKEWWEQVKYNWSH